MPEDKPWDVHDVTSPWDPRSGTRYNESWFWCRAHNRSEFGEWSSIGCVRIGPFIDQQESHSAGRALMAVRSVGGPACDKKGPYLPVGDTEWRCATHGVDLIRVAGTPGDQGTRAGMACSVGEAQRIADVINDLLDERTHR